MPSPRYYPIILERDEKGRIVTSKFPPLISRVIVQRDELGRILGSRVI